MVETTAVPLCISDSEADSEEEQRGRAGLRVGLLQPQPPGMSFVPPSSNFREH